MIHERRKESMNQRISERTIATKQRSNEATNERIATKQRSNEATKQRSNEATITTNERTNERQ